MADSADSRSVAQLLLQAARQDLAACRLLSRGAGIGDALVGFHAQQAAEKAIKAVLSAHGIAFRRTHDLATLLDLLQDSLLPEPPGADWLDELNPYAVEARYGTVDPKGLDRERTLVVMAQVIDWAQQQVSTS